MNKRDEIWDEYYYEVEDYYKEFGDIIIPLNYVQNGYNIGEFINRQRCYLKKGRISEDHKMLLDDLGMVWDLREYKWLQKFKELIEYYKMFGTINVPQKYKTDASDTGECDLGLWVKQLRDAYFCRSSYRITREHIKLLNEYNFDWYPHKTSFLNRKIEDMDKYKKEMLERMKYILEDLSYEIDGNIDSSEKLEEINKEIIKRIWR